MTYRDKIRAWLNARAEAAHKDSEAHPEGSTNRVFYYGQAIAYENAASAALVTFDDAQDPPTATDTDRQQPSEVAAILEAAADHAGASAATYRRLAALMKAPGFAHVAAACDGVEIDGKGRMRFVGDGSAVYHTALTAEQARKHGVITTEGPDTGRGFTADPGTPPKPNTFVSIDIEKAMRDAYGRGYAHCGRQAGEAPQGLNGYNDERDAWIRQYMARLLGGSDA